MLHDGNRAVDRLRASSTPAPTSVVTMRIATSLISVDQAKHNLGAGDRPADTFDDRRATRAGARGTSKLGVVDGPGRDAPTSSTTLYSNLYRLNLYPELGVREHGHDRRPGYAHAVQSSTRPPPSTPTQTGAPVVPGQGLRQQRLLGHLPDRRGRPTRCSYPEDAGEMVDGFVQQYRDGGWIARWSSPGYANLMTGTSSDVAFADAYVKGVQRLRRQGRLRRGAEERDGRAAGRPVRLRASAARA